MDSLRPKDTDEWGERENGIKRETKKIEKRDLRKR